MTDLTQNQTDRKSENVVFQHYRISRKEKERRNDHRGAVVWLTGLSASGKTTVAAHLEQALFKRGHQVMILDGDNVRHGLCSDLRFSPEDREENIRRVGEVALLGARQGMLVLAAFISPYRGDRDRIRAGAEREGDFVEVWVKCSLGECERRDPKGLYEKARAGEIADFTGVSAPYEEPRNAEIVLDTESKSPGESAAEIIKWLEENWYLQMEKE